jgi:hypothetical protein
VDVWLFLQLLLPGFEILLLFVRRIILITEFTEELRNAVIAKWRRLSLITVAVEFACVLAGSLLLRRF